MRRTTGLRVRSIVLSVAMAAAVGSAGAAPLAPEFLVNGHTTGQQWAGSLAYLSDGTFVITWHGPGTGDADGVWARRFSASGVPAGPELRVNALTTGYQWQPAVASVPGGGFVVAWSGPSQDGDAEAVLARRYDAFGAAIGGEFQVNTFTQGRQYQPRIAIGPAGQFVVAWTSFGGDGNHFGMKARRYDAGGAPIGGEFQVNTFTDYWQMQGAVGFDDSGRFVIVWASAAGHDGNLIGVFGQRYEASGARPARSSASTHTRPATRAPSTSRWTAPATSSSCGPATSRTAAERASSASASTRRQHPRAGSSA